MHLMYEIYKNEYKKLCNIPMMIGNIKVLNKRFNSLCKK